MITKLKIFLARIMGTPYKWGNGYACEESYWSRLKGGYLLSEQAVDTIVLCTYWVVFIAVLLYAC